MIDTYTKAFRAFKFWTYAMEATTISKREYWLSRYDGVVNKKYAPRSKRLRPVEGILG